MKILDIETDGFLEKLTQITCAVVYDTDTGEYTRYNAENNGQKSIEDFIDDISSGDLLAHFGLGFDYPAIKKLYPNWEPAGVLYDSVLISQLIWTNLKEQDFARIMKPRFKDFPKRLIGSHSLKAWGWRLGDFKDDFDPKNYEREDGTAHTWETIGWCQDMEDYCVQDVVVTKTFWDLIVNKNYSQEAITLEHKFATIIRRQERFGFKYDQKKSDVLQRELMLRKSELCDKLAELFPPWIVETPFTPKVNNKTRGYVKGVPTVKTKTIVFNPSSRDHIASRLRTLYNWKPKVFNKGDGKPTVDDSILKKLPYEPAKYLAEYFLIDKRLGMLAEGKQAWTKKLKEGRLHGRVDTIGAVTGRCTHSNPNVAQVPSVKAPYGEQCRDLFVVDTGYKLVGADASGLELRCLAHFMAAHDSGNYTEVILNGDVHTENQKAAGLPSRDNAKTFIYGFLYGAGDGKIGEIVGKGAKEGSRLRKQFLTSLPALEKLTTGVKKKAKATKTLQGLDGRILHVRSDHAALNTLLQSAGALIMKQALIELDTLLQDAGLKNSLQSPTPDYEFVANIHDEWQAQVLEEHATTFAELSVRAMQLAGEHFNFRCPIYGEAKIGNSWMETH